MPKHNSNPAIRLPDFYLDINFYNWAASIDAFSTFTAEKTKELYKLIDKLHSIKGANIPFIRKNTNKYDNDGKMHCYRMINRLDSTRDVAVSLTHTEKSKKIAVFYFDPQSIKEAMETNESSPKDAKLENFLKAHKLTHVIFLAVDQHDKQKNKELLAEVNKFSQNLNSDKIKISCVDENSYIDKIDDIAGVNKPAKKKDTTILLNEAKKQPNQQVKLSMFDSIIGTLKDSVKIGNNKDEAKPETESPSLPNTDITTVLAKIKQEIQDKETKLIPALKNKFEKKDVSNDEDLLAIAERQSDEQVKLAIYELVSRLYDVFLQAQIPTDVEVEMLTSEWFEFVTYYKRFIETFFQECVKGDSDAQTIIKNKSIHEHLTTLKEMHQDCEEYLKDTEEHKAKQLKSLTQCFFTASMHLAITKQIAGNATQEISKLFEDIKRIDNIDSKISMLLLVNVLCQEIIAKQPADRKSVNSAVISECNHVAARTSAFLHQAYPELDGKQPTLTEKQLEDKAWSCYEDCSSYSKVDTILRAVCVGIMTVTFAVGGAIIGFGGGLVAGILTGFLTGFLHTPAMILGGALVGLGSGASIGYKTGEKINLKLSLFAPKPYIADAINTVKEHAPVVALTA